MKAHIACVALCLAFFSSGLAQSEGQPDQQASSDREDAFHLSSTTFTNGGQLPLSMVLGSNACSFVSGGGDQSPELSWKNVPDGTRSFVVTLFDATLGFTHWGMYNISSTTRELSENAGIAGSAFGKQVFNDFGLEQYDGPCPPNNIAPLNHKYVLTVYAIDRELNVATSPPGFPFTPGAETLYRYMFGHILAKASIHGFFSSSSQ